MGDISRHRDIFLNTAEAVPGELLAKCKLTPNDLTFLELGNFLTDVSQFRDPVTYISSKQLVWREHILPGVREEDLVEVMRVLSVLGAAASAAATAALGATGTKALVGLGAIPGALLLAQGLLTDDVLAGLAGLDTWIDRMFGTPFERLKGDAKKRKDEDYGFVGQFFQHFIRGMTHFLFASQVKNQTKGEWGKITRIPEQSVEDVYAEFFTQYYPHEHTDQPPYVWDASERTEPKNKKWYGVSRRQQTLENTDIGVMNAVDEHYTAYLAEELTRLQDEFGRIKSEDAAGRRTWLVKLGKVLHGVEDWFFHSNVVELIQARGHKPPREPAEDGETFVRRFVQKELNDAAFRAESNAENRLAMRRRLYRRLRFPVYDRGNKANPAGFISRRNSTLSLHHAYPAFPSAFDTPHTLLKALENLEEKLVGKLTGGSSSSAIPAWLPCVGLNFFFSDGDQLIKDKAARRGVPMTTIATALANPSGPAMVTAWPVLMDAMREWVPLVLTLLFEEERQRLAENIDPLQWNPATAAPDGKPKGSEQQEEQLKLHQAALKPKTHKDGITENNYARAARLLERCEYINVIGKDALVKAFEIDAQSEALHSGAPGAGGFLIQFAVKLQRQTNESHVAIERLNKKANSIFEQASHNGAIDEIVGSHSLMSKDTVTSSPFFLDARVLASVASLSVFQLMLGEVSTPDPTTGVHWRTILWHFIRYPLKADGWERKALAFFREKGQIPKVADLPELAELGKSARLPKQQLESIRNGTRRADLEQEYVNLEQKVSRYRYPS